MQGLRSPRASGDIDIENRRVLVRADLCSPYANAGDENALLVERLAATLEPMLKREARVIVAAHLESSNHEPCADSLEELGANLAALLGCEIRLPDEVLGDGVTKLANDTRAGEVLLLENLARDPGETTSSPEFGRHLASLCDAYVNDAPYASRLGWSSTTQVPLRMAATVRAAGNNLRPTLVTAQQIGQRQGPTAWIVQLSATTEAIALVSQLAVNLRARDEVHILGPGALVLAHTLARPETTAYGRSLAQECKLLHAKVSAREAELVTALSVDLVPERQKHLHVEHLLGEPLPEGHHYRDVAAKSRSRFYEGMARCTNALFFDLLDPTSPEMHGQGAWVVEGMKNDGIRFAAGVAPALAISRTSRGSQFSTSIDPQFAISLLAGTALPAVQALLREN
jgi:phosphoglycerate kinase